MSSPNFTIVALSTFLICLSAQSCSYSLESAEKGSVMEEPIFISCELLDDSTVRCQPSGTYVESYSITGRSDSLYTVSSTHLDYVDGDFSKALRLHEKLGESFEILNNTNLDPNQFSISFSIRADSNFTGIGQILSHTNFKKNSGWFVSLDNRGHTNDLEFGVLNSTGNSFVTGPVHITDNNFTRITCIFDGSAVRLYQDGRLKSEVKFAGVYHPSPNVPLRLGIASFSEDQWWSGTIDELRFYGRAISDGEVRKISIDSTKSLSQEKELGHWTFDDTLRDLSGNANDIAFHLETVSMDFTPDGRLFFAVKNTGEIGIMQDDKVLKKPFATISNIHVGDHQGLLGIVVDPHFSANHFVYAYETYRDAPSASIFNRILRYTDKNSSGTDLKIILDKIPADPGGYYAGGALAFGLDDKLYVTVGIGVHPEQSQNKSSLLGKVLRLNRDGSVPTDNPFHNSPVFDSGNKNPYGLAFNKEGLGILTDNGDTADDEINILQPGKNYGFPIEQGFKFGANASFVSPIRDYYAVIAPTQAIYYDGKIFPSLNGSFLIGSFNRGHIYAIKLSENNTRISETEIFFPFAKHDSVIALAESPTGQIYFGGYEIHKLKLLDQLSRRQISFPISVTLSDDMTIKGTSYSSKNQTMIFNFGSSGQKSTVHQAMISIPKSLLSGIYAVNEIPSPNGPVSEKNILDYKINNARGGSPVTTIHIDFKSNATVSTSVVGTKPLNPYSFFAVTEN
jgi:glucose/arabinose dehydrogenase